jgi:aspartate aminotransferase
LNGPQESVAAMAKEFQRRRDVIVERLNAIDGVTCMKPLGAFLCLSQCFCLLRPFLRGKDDRQFDGTGHLSAR